MTRVSPHGAAGTGQPAAPAAGAGPVDTFARDNLPPPQQWPELLFDLPALHYPARLNCVAELLDSVVDSGRGARLALHSETDSWTYAELQRRVNQIAQVLRGDLGLVPGNRVLLRGANTPMMAACFLAVIKAGCIAVPTMPLLRARELGAIVDKARIDAVLCAASLRGEMDLLPRVQPPPPLLCFDAAGTDGANQGASLETLMAQHGPHYTAFDSAADDICLIGFTSGTTGVPKGTLHFHRDLLIICDCFPRSTLDSQDGDVFIGTPPLAFTFGLGGLLLFPLRVAGSAVLLDKLTPEKLLSAIERFHATVLFTVPTFYRQMTPQAGNYDLSSLRKSVSAGEALPQATRDDWQQATGLAMIDGIGATELLHIFISATGEQGRRGAVGKPIPGYQACILDDDGRPVGPGVIGRLAIKGPTGCRYLDDERQRDYVLDGWNLTGDAFEMDADGYFYYRARSDDMIVSAGYNIAGAEVEEALLRHPDVAECGVVGHPDLARGQVVEAHVVLKPGVVASDALALALQDFVKAQIAPYKYPRAIVFVAALPRTETGKLQRYKLRGRT